MKALLCYLMVAIFVLSISDSFAQTWSPVAESSVAVLKEKQVIKPEKYSLQKLEVKSLLDKLHVAPKEFSHAAKVGSENIIPIPMPDGTIQRFRFSESPIMEPGLAEKFPEIKTYSAQGIDDPYASMRMDYNPYFGFHAQIISPDGFVYVDPYAKGNTGYYMSYYSKELKKDQPFICNTPNSTLAARLTASGPCRGTQLFTYRLALACTGEYAVAVCLPNPPTVPATLAAMTTSVNRVNSVYEAEVAVRLNLIANTNLLIYLDGTTDPYTNNNGNTMLGENKTNIDAVIGPANYDIGHVFSTGGGGIAGLGVVCTANKAWGVTGLSNPVGDAFDIDYVAHEMGHQFGGNHTFNSMTGSCGGGNRNAGTAYEVGSGTTIMSYAGICGSDDIQPHSDPFFHTVSFDEISIFLSSGSGGTCNGIIATGNAIPVVTAMNNNGVTIPELTPFILTGSATDADGDAVTYCWEEWDLGKADSWDGGASSLTVPLFKSRIPKSTGARMFPDINVILAGYPAAPAATMGGLKGETLSDPNGSQTRTSNFKLTVRDNKAGGGAIATGGGDASNLGCSLATAFSINIKGGTGAFAVTIPNGGENWLGGTSQTVTWNVSSTTAAPISTANVTILMSVDGGLTYPTTLIASTPNDGTQLVAIPNIPTNTTVRLMVMAVGNIFFDISNANFTITQNTPLPVGLLDFNATAKTNHIDLTWRTAFEQNNSGFEIQRSSGNASAFSAINTVAGQGNGFSDRTYNYSDNNVSKNIRYYYRLKQVDLDGKITYSPIRSVILKDSKLANITINPNPVTEDKLMLSMNQNRLATLQTQIIDNAGRVLMQAKYTNVLPGSVLQIPLTRIAAGVYTLRLVSDGDIESMRFVKQ